MKDLEFRGKMKLLSPLSHNSDENYGTDVIFRKSKIKVNDSFEEIPVLSGNGIRGVLRRLIADDYLKLLELSNIKEKLFYILFAGGMLESVTDALEVENIKKIRELIPFISIFGTAFSNKMIHGKMKVGMGQLICEETNHLTGHNSNHSFVEFLDEIFYTRRDDLENKETDKAHQMKYSGEVLVPGSELHHFFVLENVNKIEESCFYRTINLFLEKPFLGGKSGIGHGKIELLDYNWRLEDSLYVDYVKSNRALIVEFLDNVI